MKEKYNGRNNEQLLFTILYFSCFYIFESRALDTHMERSKKKKVRLVPTYYVRITLFMVYHLKSCHF